MGNMDPEPPGSFVPGLSPNFVTFFFNFVVARNTRSWRFRGFRA